MNWILHEFTREDFVFVERVATFLAVCFAFSLLEVASSATRSKISNSHTTENLAQSREFVKVELDLGCYI